MEEQLPMVVLIVVFHQYFHRNIWLEYKKEYNKLSISLQDENDQLVQFDDKTLTVGGLIFIQPDF